MSFFPILSADLYVAQVELIETVSSAGAFGATAKMNLGDVLYDSGGLITTSANEIVCPQGYEFMCIGCITQTSKTGTTSVSAQSSFFVNGVSASPTALNGVWPAGYTISFSTSAMLMCHFTTPSGASTLSVCDTSGSSGFTIAYNSATNTIPNSAITILYKAL